MKTKIPCQEVELQGRWGENGLPSLGRELGNLVTKLNQRPRSQQWSTRLVVLRALVVETRDVVYALLYAHTRFQSALSGGRPSSKSIYLRRTSATVHPAA